MKCVMFTQQHHGWNEFDVVRVADELAQKLVAKGVAEYTNKLDWKCAGRRYWN